MNEWFITTLTLVGRQREPFGRKANKEETKKKKEIENEIQNQGQNVPQLRSQNAP